jgi:hypothetical protein
MRMRTFLILDLGLDIVDGVAAIDLQRDRLVVSCGSTRADLAGSTLYCCINMG